MGERTAVAVESQLGCPAAVAFEAALQPATFSYVSFGMLGMPSLCGREEPFVAGEQIAGRLYLGNLIPLWMHEMDIISIDAEARRLVSNERGGAIRVWNHTVDVDVVDAGSCRLRDSVLLDAGALTDLAVAWAQAFYRYRHRRWQRLVFSWGYRSVGSRGLAPMKGEGPGTAGQAPRDQRVRL